MIDRLIDLVGDRTALALGGAIIGVLFGALAQRSRFCLRAATLEVAHGDVGGRLAIWLFAFSTALISTQALIMLGLFDAGIVRQLNNRGSLSGSIIGGLMFGCGMTLTRACGSRMLVLAATGNLRALLSGLVFAVVAQMSRAGALSPLRTAINDWWTIDASSRERNESTLSKSRAITGRLRLIEGTQDKANFVRASLRLQAPMRSISTRERSARSCHSRASAGLH